MQPDALGSFSLIGPSFTNVIKPDVQAPGVSILAAIQNDNSANGANRVGLMDGTSMATPHTTGTAALLVQIHPDWSPMEIKSALMMTAKEAGLTKPNGVTPSDFYDRGAGRIEAWLASQAGLVLDETQANFQAADPSKGGEPAKLNLASMDQMRCLDPATHALQCSFTRQLSSAKDHAVTWTATLTGEASGPLSTVSPASFQVDVGGTQGITVTVDSSVLSSDGKSHFGELVLTPDDGSPVLHMPISVAVPAPAISAPAAVTVNIPSGSTTQSTNLPIGNIGGPTLNVNPNYTGTAPYVVLNQPITQQQWGYYSYMLPDLPGGADGAFNAQNFQISGSNGNLSRITAYGFSDYYPLSYMSGIPVHFRIYHDAGGKPDGSPTGKAPQNNAPAWSYDAFVDDWDLTTTSTSVSLDLVAGGISTNLPAGNYWLVVYPEIDSSWQTGWAWFASDSNSGSTAMSFQHLFTPYDTDWNAHTDPGGGMAVRIEQQITCGAPWLNATPSQLNIGAFSSANASVSVDSTKFDSGNPAVGYLCLQSNDAKNPITVVRVNATQK